ncbi:hypothetical protein E2K80_00040 [Rhodophyticola sp. CCM32]|nr:hypothetical protein E2K80_00040 [Rhodophyticola sp. CCM32]
MFDCSADVCAFHNQEVTLPGSERQKMRSRRDTNRNRLDRNLDTNDLPKAIEHVSQGSYEMKTMLQDQNNDYDIDDGVYFDKEDLVGDRGAYMTSLQARQMVRDAMDDGCFKTPPEVRSNCVRIYYSAGYYVDKPVYRRVEEDGAIWFELASSSGWKRSDARDVSSWYEEERNASSDPIQFRRINRHLKKHAKSRNSWKSRSLSGFGISTLLSEQHHLNSDREDEALYYTMVAIRNRLTYNTVIDHPVTPNDTITSGSPDAKAAFFRDKLSEAIDHLAPLFEYGCDRETALKCWDKVFNTTFFIERCESDNESNSALAAPAISSGALLGSAAQAAGAVNDAGGGRHA